MLFSEKIFLFLEKDNPRKVKNLVVLGAFAKFLKPTISCAMSVHLSRPPGKTRIQLNGIS
jgi:hypothetical protein